VGTPMSWKLILGLSLFGLAMGFATVFALPPRNEPYAWIAIFVVCAYIIAKRAPSKYFLHGLCVSLMNSVWVTGAHVLLFDKYLAGHAREAMMAAKLAQIGTPKVVMAVTGPIVGLVSGIVLGLLAVILSKFVQSRHSEYAGW
jgi:uncharacterized membrane protein